MCQKLMFAQEPINVLKYLAYVYHYTILNADFIWMSMINKKFKWHVAIQLFSNGSTSYLTAHKI